MTDDRHERIRQRAHEIWEQAGRPEGAHKEHWEQATAEIDAAGKPKAKSPKKVAAAKAEKPKAAKAEKPAKAPAKAKAAKPKAKA
ncbi:MAG: DUF2934 domain-containing protein [Mesorhizobium sp.]|uniref:DUF2934 domain-containing protein n=1 Tax=Mesorhizobium sp. TaxID=1871066 RepID=UPI000FE4CBB3|nr:DUF2934 domain-containing protein [Mesorhizobium sp.]RWB66659.1 MAG: DUF2934 domain-containing protein [Mesorhizobium sp.]RWL83584.1 MAG: DUF2934 domain-containing protein [Mesorhizobium sp.]RWL90735.1 MAG: DUF2934 domain-containing protein [Mesorhizobium sp.]RWL98299.1 MAG: DUF2934 domain-containing protein [Mesorhizobium sp.]RWM00325.1 MAG: DUF2934 domain-containing protein [Mesorhizobium sp.]